MHLIIWIFLQNLGAELNTLLKFTSAVEAVGQEHGIHFWQIFDSCQLRMKPFLMEKMLLQAGCQELAQERCFDASGKMVKLINKLFSYSHYVVL